MLQEEGVEALQDGLMPPKASAVPPNAGESAAYLPLAQHHNMMHVSDNVMPSLEHAARQGATTRRLCTPTSFMHRPKIITAPSEQHRFMQKSAGTSFWKV